MCYTRFILFRLIKLKHLKMIGLQKIGRKDTEWMFLKISREFWTDRDRYVLSCLRMRYLKSAVFVQLKPYFKPFSVLFILYTEQVLRCENWKETTTLSIESFIYALTKHLTDKTSKVNIKTLIFIHRNDLLLSTVF